MIEASFGTILAAVSGMSVETAIAMYTAVDNQRLRYEALRAAAAQSLTGEDLRIFNAAMIYLKRQSAARNDFAHRVWGITETLPSHILLANPKEMWRSTAAVFRIGLNPEYPSQPVGGPLTDWHAVMAYTERDLVEIASQLEAASLTSNRLLMLVSDIFVPKEQARELLLSDPGVRAALQRVA